VPREGFEGTENLLPSGFACYTPLLESNASAKLKQVKGLLAAEGAPKRGF
jgi:hypothetical protein